MAVITRLVKEIRLRFYHQTRSL